jgi:hypothetical protein
MLVLLGQTALAAPADLCQGNHSGKVSDPSFTRKYDQGIGFNLSQYVLQRYTSPGWHIGGNTEQQEKDVAKQREKFRTDKLKTFIKDRGAAVLDVPAVLELIDHGDAWTALQSRTTPLAPAVRIYEERAEIDCSSGIYTYSVELLTPRNPLQILPYPVRSALEEAVDKVVGEPFGGGAASGALTFRIGDIVDRIRKILAANDAVVREGNKPETALRLLHPRFRELFPVSVARNYTFAVGEYRLSPEMSYIIEQIVRRFLRRPEAENAQFDLVVKGYTDARPVREIAYDGACDLTIRPNETAEVVIARHEGPSVSAITSNSQLSIARGCEGARFARNLIPAARRIRVFYSGGDAIAGAPQDAYRGIELRFDKNLSSKS